MTHDLDVIRQAIEDRDAAIAEREQLATEMIYRGNSVSWWHSKAIAYSDALGRCWDALREAGIHPDGETDVATAIRQLAERSNPEWGGVTPLEKFGRWCLDEMRGEHIGDIDGGAAQDKAIELGLLGFVTVEESCGEHCHCAEYYDAFPAGCLRETPLAKDNQR